jgi:hypothetical protein
VAAGVADALDAARAAGAGSSAIGSAALGDGRPMCCLFTTYSIPIARVSADVFEVAAAPRTQAQRQVKAARQLPHAYLGAGAWGLGSKALAGLVVFHILQHPKVTVTIKCQRVRTPAEPAGEVDGDLGQCQYVHVPH